MKKPVALAVILMIAGTSLSGCYTLHNRATVRAVNKVIRAFPEISGQARGTLGPEGATKVATEIEVSNQIDPQVLNDFLSQYSALDWKGEMSSLQMKLKEDQVAVYLDKDPKPVEVWEKGIEFLRDFPHTKLNFYQEKIEMRSADAKQVAEVVTQLGKSYAKGAKYSLATSTYAPEAISFTVFFRNDKPLGGDWAKVQAQRLNNWWEQSQKIDHRLALYYRGSAPFSLNTPDRYTVVALGWFSGGYKLDDLVKDERRKANGLVPFDEELPTYLVAQQCEAVAKTDNAANEQKFPVYCGGNSNKFSFYWQLENQQLSTLLPLQLGKDFKKTIPGRLPFLNPVGIDRIPVDPHIPGAETENEPFTDEQRSALYIG
ncbi:hypothetical protein BK816_05890 [Boudabousia tangfeifanii]|uniref:Lipoprotein n=1 Tax=Boudabousia tangfeifanii TaxID=1912795 RepID=A0A1D9ML51_9ACTO|nr:hypothetical protein [Boudabousia tangfeifanii]AOZ72880.1 hypothetical protein BK816_05890 [Boudabousia tangfeifanii]